MNFGENLERNHSPNNLTTNPETRSSLGMKNIRQGNGPTVPSSLSHMLKCFQNTTAGVGLFPPIRTSDSYSSAVTCGIPEYAALPGSNDAKPGTDGQLEKEMFIHGLLEAASSAPGLLPFLTFPLPPPQIATMGQLSIPPIDVPGSQYANTVALAKETADRYAAQACNGSESSANLLEKYVPQTNLADTAATSMTMTSGPPLLALAPTTSSVTPTKEAAAGSMDESSSPEATSILNASIPALGSNAQMNDMDKVLMDKSLEQAGSMQQIASLLQLQNMSGLPPFFFPLLAPPVPPSTTVTSISQTFTVSNGNHGNDSSNTGGYFNSESVRAKPMTSGGQSGSGHKTEDDFCELCQKHFCNKYYLRKHKADVHGIYTEPHSHARRREAAAQSTASYVTGCKNSMNSSGQPKPTFSSGPEDSHMKSDAPFKMDVDERPPIFLHRNDSNAVGNNSYQAPTTVHLPSVVKSASTWAQQPEMSAKHQTNQSLPDNGYNNNQHPSSIFPTNGPQLPDINALQNLGGSFPFAPILGMPPTRSASFDSMLSAQYCMLALTGALPQGLGPELPTPFGQPKGWNGSKPIDTDNNPLFALPGLSRSPNGIHEVKCDQCQKIFCNQYFLQVHRANHHGGENEQGSLEKKSFSKYNSLDSREGNSMVRQFDNETFQASSSSQIKSTDDSKYKETKSVMNDVKSNSQANSDTSVCQDYKLGGGSSHTILSQSTPSTRETSFSTTEFKTSSTTSLDAFKTSMVAAKLADRVTCDLCKKELCNKYFLRTHKIRVHGVSPRDVGGPPMRNPPVVNLSHNSAHPVSPVASVASSKTAGMNIYDYSGKECTPVCTSGSQILAGSQFLVGKQNPAVSSANAKPALGVNAADFSSLPVDQLPPTVYPFPYVPMIPQLFQVASASNNSVSLPNMTTNSSPPTELAPTDLVKTAMDTNCNSMPPLLCPDKQLPWLSSSRNENIPSISSLLPGNGSSVYCPLCEHSVGPRFLLPAHLTSVHNLSPTETSFFLYLLQAKPVLPGCGDTMGNAVGLPTSTATPSWALAQTTTGGTSELRVEPQQPGTTVRIGESSASTDEAKLTAEVCVGSEPTSKSESNLHTGMEQGVPIRVEGCGTKDASSSEESLNLQAMSRHYEAHQVNAGWKGEFYTEIQESLVQSLRSMIKTKNESYQLNTPSNPTPLHATSLPALTQSIVQNMAKPDTSSLETNQQIPLGIPYLAPMPTGIQGTLPPTNHGGQPAALSLNAAAGFMGLPMSQLDTVMATAEKGTPVDQRISDEFNNNPMIPPSAGGIPWNALLPSLNTATTPSSSASQSISPVQAMATSSSNVSPLASSVTSGTGGMMPRKSPNQMRVLCDICNKWICNKYFLRTHKANKHGITESNQHFASSLDGNCKFNVTNQPPGQKYQGQHSQINTVSQFQALNCAVSAREKDVHSLPSKEMNVDTRTPNHHDDYPPTTPLPFNSNLNTLSTGFGDSKFWLNRFDPQVLTGAAFPTLQTAIHDPVVMDHLTTVWKNKLSEVGNQLGSEVNNPEGPQPPIHQNLPFFPFGAAGNLFLPGTNFPIGSSVVPASTAIVPHPSVSQTTQSDSKSRFTSEELLSSMQIFEEHSRALDLCPKSQAIETNTEGGSAFAEEVAAVSCETNQESRAPLNLSFNCSGSTKHSLAPTRTYSRPHKPKKERLIHLASNYLRRAKKHRVVNSNVSHFIHKSKWRLGQIKYLHDWPFDRESSARWRIKRWLDKKRVNQFLWSPPVGNSSYDSMNHQTKSIFPVGPACSAQEVNGVAISALIKTDDNQNTLHATDQIPNIASIASNTRHLHQPHSFQISQLARSSRDLEATDQSEWFQNEETSTTAAPGLSTKEANMHEQPANGLTRRSILMPLKAYRKTLSTTM